MSLYGFILCKFVSRSDFVLDADVLDADHGLCFLSFPFRISFCSVSDKSGASLFLPCSHKIAVAHVFLTHFGMPIFGAIFREKQSNTSTVAALFSKMALTAQRIAMVDVVLLVLQHFHIYRRGGWSQSLPLKISLSCSLGGGGI